MSSVTLTLADVLPNWGEGASEAEARDVLLLNVLERHRELSAERDRLASGLLDEVVFMERLVAGVQREAVGAVRERDLRRDRRWVALGFGLPWGWEVRQTRSAIVGTGPALPCGHRSVSKIIPEGDLLLAASRFAVAVRLHVQDGV